MNPINKNAYFESREVVGKVFAKQLEYLKGQNIAVLAVSPGGLIIGFEIANLLNTEIGLLKLKQVSIPGYDNFGMINSSGLFTNTQNITSGEIEEFNIEYRNSIASNKFNAMHDLHVMGGVRDFVAKDYDDKFVIIVSDMAKTGTSIKAALDFLHIVNPKSIIIASAVAQVQAVDIMHQYGDKVLCLHSTDKEFSSSHYFGDNTIPNNEEIVEILGRALSKN